MRALLVDLDGTLADTSFANYSAYAEALREAGAPVSRTEFDAIAQGRNWRQFVPEFLARNGSQADAWSVAKRKQELYPAMLAEVRINAGLVSLIAAWHESRATALVTTASRANALAVLAQHSLAALFDVVITGDDVQRHKPDPSAYLLAASKLDVQPESCLVFEDSDIGVDSAIAAGMQVVRVVF